MNQETLAKLVKQLVEKHGEGGVCPKASEWHAIFQIDGPLRILNLLKFRPSVHGALHGMSGASAYARYMHKVAGAFRRAGGEQLFFAPVGLAFGLGKFDGWDAVNLSRYPSARAVADMWLDPKFAAAHEHRVDGVERSQVMVFSGGE